MEYVQVRLIDLPFDVPGFTVYYFDNGQVFYTMLINAGLNDEQHIETYRHEMNHIDNGDFDRMLPLEKLESERHNEFRRFKRRAA